jgi:hypothetical protein
MAGRILTKRAFAAALAAAAAESPPPSADPIIRPSMAVARSVQVTRMLAEVDTVRLTPPTDMVFA